MSVSYTNTVMPYYTNSLFSSYNTNSLLSSYNTNSVFSSYNTNSLLSSYNTSLNSGISSNSIMMQFMQILLQYLLQGSSTTSTNDGIEVIDEPIMPDFDDDSDLTEVKDGDETTISDTGERIEWVDDSGEDTLTIDGDENYVLAHGDSNANTFNIDGYDNVVYVQNIGRDETINLIGDGWSEYERGDDYIVYYNEDTYSWAKLQTDDGRDADFVEDKVYIE